MPDIAQQLQDFANEFGKVEKDFFKSRKDAVVLADQMKILAKKNEEFFEGFTKGGRLTVKGMKELQGQIEITSKLKKKEKKQYLDMLKAQAKVQKATNKQIDALSDATKKITKKIPLIGTTIQKGFEDKIFPMLAKTLDKNISTKLFKGISKVASGGMSLVKKLSIFAAIGAAIRFIVKGITDAEQRTVGFVKQFGILRDDAQKLSKIISNVRMDIGDYGVSLDLVEETTNGLLSNFANISDVNENLIKSASRMAHIMGMSGDEISELYASLNQSLGFSVEQIDEMSMLLKSKATTAGISTSMVFRDIAKNANFINMYTGGTGENILNAAIYAKKLGSNLETTVGMGEQFLDIETSIEKTAELNMILGTKMNALELHQLAMAGDYESIQKQIISGAADQYNFLEKNILARKTVADLANISTEELMKQLKLSKGIDDEQTRAWEEQKKSADSIKEINDALRATQTWWSKIIDPVKNTLLTALEQIGAVMNDRINPIAESISKQIKIFKDELIGVANANDPIAAMLEKIVDKLGEILGKAIDIALDKLRGRSAALDFIIGEKKTPEREVKNVAADVQGEVLSNMIPGVPKFIASALVKKQVGERQENIKDYTPFAEGGLVTKPTKALIGEAGPELVLPLGGNNLSDIAGGGQIKMASGGAVIPLSMLDELESQSSGAFRGNIESQSTPAAQRRREQEIKQVAEAYREDLKKEERELLDKEYELQRRRERDTTTFGVHTKGFGIYAKNIKTNLQNVFSKVLPESISGAIAAGLTTWMATGDWRKGVKAGVVEAFSSDQVLGKWADMLGNKIGLGNISSDVQMGVAAYFQSGSWEKGLQTGIASGFKEGHFLSNMYKQETELAQHRQMSAFSQRYAGSGLEMTKAITQQQRAAAGGDYKALGNLIQLDASTGMQGRMGMVGDQLMGGARQGAVNTGMAGLATFAQTGDWGATKDAMKKTGMAMAQNVAGKAILTAIPGGAAIASIPGIGDFAGSAIGGLVFKGLGIGTYKKSEKRKNAMKALEKSMGNRDLSTFTAPNTLLKSMTDPNTGEINEGSKDLTIKAVKEKLNAAPGKPNFTDQEVMTIVAGLIGESAGIDSQTQSQILNMASQEMWPGNERDGVSTSTGITTASPKAVATIASKNSGVSISPSGGQISSGITTNNMRGESAAELARLREEQAEMKRAIYAVANRPVQINIDGRKVAESVNEHSEEIAREI